jgi:hypothetical protein
VWGTELNDALNQINGYDVFKRSAADESVVSSTVLQNDDDLVVSVVASATYLVQWHLRTDGATGAADLKYAFTGPAGATMVWSSLGLDVGAATNVAPISQDVLTLTTTINHGTIGVGTVAHVRGSGILVVSTTAGSLQTQWAQATANATATRVLANSWLWARRMA